MNDKASVGAGRMFFGDAIITFLVINEMRHRLVAWVFGVPREDSNRMTVIAAGTIAEGVHGSAARVLAAGALPSAAAIAMGAAAIKEGGHAIAGESSRAIPFFGAVVAFAVLGKSFLPALRSSLQGVQASMNGARAGARRLYAFVQGH